MRSTWAMFAALILSTVSVMHGISTKFPEMREAMLKLWDEYVQRNGVIVSDAGPFAN